MVTTVRTGTRHKAVAFEIDGCGCHNCTSHSPDGDGYPKILWQGKRISVARMIYQWSHGPLGTAQKVRHTCNNFLCINGDHLIEGSQQENVDDRTKAGRSVGRVPGIRRYGWRRTRGAKKD